MAFVVLAWWQAAPGHEGRVAELLDELRTATLDEPGCLEYRIHRDADDDCRFLLYEAYRTRDGYEEHGQTPHFERLARQEAFSLLTGRTREFYITDRDDLPEGAR